MKKTQNIKPKRNIHLTWTVNMIQKNFLTKSQSQSLCILRNIVEMVLMIVKNEIRKWLTQAFHNIKF